MQQNNASELSPSKTLNRLANCLGMVVGMYLMPLASKHAKPHMHDYLIGEYGHQIAYYGSWVFVAMLILSAWYTVALLIQMLFKKSFFKKKELI